MVYTKEYEPKKSQPQIKEFNLIGTDNLIELYNQVEIVLCEKLNSGFGRNLDALYDVLTGGFGIIYYTNLNKTNDIIFNINVSKSKLLTPKMYKLFEEANEYNKENNTINILMS